MAGIPELLTADVFKSGAPQVSELVGGTVLNSIGAVLSESAADSQSVSKKNVTNRSAEYRGQVYCIFYFGSNAGRIHSFNRGTGLWTVVAGFSALSGRMSGLYIVNTGTVQRLCLYAQQTGSSAFQISYTDVAGGGGWTTVSPGGNSGSMLEGLTVAFGNKLYQLTTAGYYEVDPVALTFTEPAHAWNVQGGGGVNGDLCVFDDRLFALVAENGSTRRDYTLWEFTGGGWSLNLEITTDGRINALSGVSEGQVCLFKDPGANLLIAIVNGTDDAATTGAGSMAFELTPSGSSFTIVDKTTTIIPSGFRPGDRVTTDAYEDRWYGYANNDAPVAPEFFLFLAQGPAPGTGHAVYEYIDANTVLTSLGAGPGVTYSLPSQKFGGGGRINKSSTGTQCVIETAAPAVGGYQVSYRVYGTGTVTVSLYYSLSQNTPDALGSISAQTGGSGISGGNAVTGVTGDDGSTLFTITWDLATDGIASGGDTVHIMLDVA